MSGGSMGYPCHSDGVHPDRHKLQMVMDHLGTLGLEETRAWEACHCIMTNMRRIERAFQDPKFSDMMRAAEWHKSSDYSEDQVAEACEEYAKSLCGGQHTVEIADFFKPPHLDCYMSSVMITGKEIQVNGGRTANFTEFMDGPGAEIIARIRGDLLSALNAWRKAKEVDNT